jgi:hypothetical protein
MVIPKNFTRQEAEKTETTFLLAWTKDDSKEKAEVNFSSGLD